MAGEVVAWIEVVETPYGFGKSYSHASGKQPTGKYVLDSDYAALARERDGLQQQVDVAVQTAFEQSKYREQAQSERDRLREALEGLLSDIDDLMSESDGVYGLHLNGDVSPWEELDEGGRFERLTHLSQARAALAGRE